MTEQEYVDNANALFNRVSQGWNGAKGYGDQHAKMLAWNFTEHVHRYQRENASLLPQAKWDALVPWVTHICAEFYAHNLPQTLGTNISKPTANGGPSFEPWMKIGNVTNGEKPFEE